MVVSLNSSVLASYSSISERDPPPTPYPTIFCPDFPNVNDEDVTRPMCGHGVLTKIIKNSPLKSTLVSHAFTNHATIQPVYSGSDLSSGSDGNSSNNGNDNTSSRHLRSIKTDKGKGSVSSTNGRSSEGREIDEGTRHLLASPDNTESSSSSSEKSQETPSLETPIDPSQGLTSNKHMVKFLHNNVSGKGDGYRRSFSKSSSTTQLKKMLPVVVPRSGMWATSIPAVNESRSVSTEETSLSKHLTTSLSLLAPAGFSVTSTIPNSLHAEIREATPSDTLDMLIAMRALVLKQQAALKKLTTENSQYREKMEEYQNKLLKMKRTHADHLTSMAQLKLEKEALETDSMYLRSQIKSLTSRRLAINNGDANDDENEEADGNDLEMESVDGNQGNKTDIYVENTNYDDNDDEDDIDAGDGEVQRKLRSLITDRSYTSVSNKSFSSANGRGKGTIANANGRSTTSPTMTNKMSLLPSSIKAVKSLNCGKSPTLRGWEFKEQKGERDYFVMNDNHSVSSESSLSDDKLIFVTQKSSKESIDLNSISSNRTPDMKKELTESRDETQESSDRTESPAGTLRQTSDSVVTKKPPSKPALSESFATYSDPVARTSLSTFKDRVSMRTSPVAVRTPPRVTSEDIDLFKLRLESLQKRRSERHMERKQRASIGSTHNKPTVRFDTATA